MARPQVPAEVVERLRAICLALPSAHEETAWVGVRWRVGKATFAHVLMVADGWPPAYARAAGSDGPLCVLTFSSPIAGLDPAHYADKPFFRPRWRPDIVGMALDARTDWGAVAQLVAGSYRALAPRKLVRMLDGP